jgi:hypothetical protein
MESTTKGSAAARMAVMYITIGVLLMVWSGIWWTYMARHPPSGDGVWFLCFGCLLSGAAFTVIGFIMGHVGRSARQADLPPTVSTTPMPGQIQPVPGQMPGTIVPPAAAPAPVVPAQVAAPPQPVAAPAVPANTTGQPVKPAY